MPYKTRATPGAGQHPNMKPNKRLKHCSNQRKVLFFCSGIFFSLCAQKSRCGVALPLLLNGCMRKQKRNRVKTCTLQKLLSLAALHDVLGWHGHSWVSSHMPSTHSLWLAKGSFLLSLSFSALSCQNERFQPCRVCQTFCL